MGDYAYVVVGEEPVEEDSILVDELLWRPGHDEGYCCSPYPKAVFWAGSLGFLLCTALAFGLVIAFKKYVWDPWLPFWGLILVGVLYLAAFVCGMITIHYREGCVWSHAFNRIIIVLASAFLVLGAGFLIAQVVLLPNSNFKVCYDWDNQPGPCANPKTFTIALGCCVSLPLITCVLGFWMTDYYGKFAPKKRRQVEMAD